MDWVSIGGRIRRQREFLGYTREQFAELLDVTPKFCSDIELGVKGCPSRPCAGSLRSCACPRISSFLAGRTPRVPAPSRKLLRSCSSSEQAYAEQLLKTFIMAMNAKESL